MAQARHPGLISRSPYDGISDKVGRLAAAHPTARLRVSTGSEHVLIGYMRVSKADGSQVVDLQRDALVSAGVAAEQLYTDRASGKRDDRPGLEACVKALREATPWWLGSLVASGVT